MSIPVPADLSAAIEAAERTTVVKVAVDWDGDGFGADGSIDDLTGRQGAITIDRQLTTDIPAPVRLVDGTGIAAGTIGLAEADPTDETMHPARYYTRGSDSILGHRERIGRPVTVDVGFVTASGPLYVRRLTGRTRKMYTSSKGRTAALDVLDNRALLRNTVTLVPTNGLEAGADGTWIVTQALAANGIYAGPGPRASGCLMWWPMYGSINPISPTRKPPILSLFSSTLTGPVATKPRFRSGPFVLAADPYYNSDTDMARLISEVKLSPTWAGSNGRLEMRVLGVPSPSAAPASAAGRTVVRMYDSTSPVTNPIVRIGIDLNGNAFLKTYANINNSIPVHAFTSGAAVPGDGGWHFVGIHFDHLAKTVTFRIDGGSETQSTAAIGAGELPTNIDDLLVISYNPCSDVLLHDVPAATSWLADNLTIGAVLDQSLITMTACFEPSPREAWDLITEMAKAEQATAVFDEAGLFRYRNRRRLTETAGQTVARLLTTADASLLDAQIDDGIDQVRNIIQVSYSPVVAASNGDPAYDYDFVIADSSQRTIASQSVTDIPYSISVVGLGTTVAPGYSGSLNLVAETVALFNSLGFGPSNGGGPFIAITFNSNFTDDGGAAVAAANLGQFTAAILNNWTPTSATVRLTNLTGQTVYVVAIGLWGQPVTVQSATVAEARDATSIAAYGPQPLQITMPQWVQTSGIAQSLAAALLGDLKDPHPQILGLSVVGDPRRQLGDRVRLADPDGTQLDGEFWLTQIKDQISEAGAYTMSISARAASSVCRYNTGRYNIETYR